MLVVFDRSVAVWASAIVELALHRPTAVNLAAEAVTTVALRRLDASILDPKKVRSIFRYSMM